jgi:pilin/secretion family protein with methylation motif
MKYKKEHNRKGVTLTELMVTLLLSTVVVLALGSVLADSQRGWVDMYSRAYSEVVTDAYVSQRVFSAVIRKSSIIACELGTSNEYVQVYYYHELSSTELDRYAKFYVSGGKLMMELGEFTVATFTPSTVLSTTTLASNVTSAVFDVKGTSVQMFLSLDNNKEQLQVTCSAVRHNNSF